MDPVIELLNQIKVKEIKVFLSKKHIISRFPQKGLWPKITISSNDKEIIVSLKDIFIPSYTKYDKHKLFGKIEIAVLSLISDYKDAKFDQSIFESIYKSVYKNKFYGVIYKIVNKILTEIKSSVNKKKVIQTRNDIVRQQILRGIQYDMSEEIRRNKLKYNEIKSHEIAKLWDDLMKELAVKDVHNS